MKKNDDQIYTATMAKLLAEQGHYEKAKIIYRRLLEGEPERRDLKLALEKLEKRSPVNRDGDFDELELLFRRWIDLLLRNQRIRKLKNLQRRLLLKRGYE